MASPNDSDRALDLRALVREVAAHAQVADPAIVAKEVEQRIADVDLADALSQALPVFVYHLNTDVTPPQPPPVDQGALDPHTKGVGGRAPASWKVAGVRRWARQLRERVSVGPSDWKFLGDCTAVDLAYAAEVRDELARANAARAAWLRHVAEQLDAAQVEHVEDLPADTLDELFGAGR